MEPLLTDNGALIVRRWRTNVKISVMHHSQDWGLSSYQLASFIGRELGYPGLVEQSLEDTLLQGFGTLQQTGEVAQGEHPLVEHRFQLFLTLVELWHLEVDEGQLVIKPGHGIGSCLEFVEEANKKAQGAEFAESVTTLYELMKELGVVKE